jgi:hypothetical protein
MKPILVPERFPMSHRSRAASSASASATIIDMDGHEIEILEIA